MTNEELYNTLKQFSPNVELIDYKVIFANGKKAVAFTRHSESVLLIDNL